MDARIVVLAMDAMRPEDRSGPGVSRGTVIATDSQRDVVDATRAICSALGWTCRIHDADRTNLHDLVEARSPLAEEVSAARRLGGRSLFVLRGANRALLDDDRYAPLLDVWARGSRLVVVTDELGAERPGWNRAEILTGAEG